VLVPIVLDHWQVLDHLIRDFILPLLSKFLSDLN
jgi:hypothetical protein